LAYLYEFKGTRTVDILGGEPLLAPWLFELIENARGIGYDGISLVTNGTLFTRARLEWLAERRIEISFSMQAATAALHDRITGLRGSFAKCREAVEMAYRLRMDLYVSIVLFGENDHELGGFIAMLRDIGIPDDRIRTDRIRPVGRAIKIAAAGVMTSPRWYDVCSQCMGQHININANGDVHCCSIARDRVIANMTEHPLPDIVRSGQYAEALADLRARAEADTRIPRETVRV
jgi:MoaA/NifB/PqqE/SkfB family radical SAM enzyme